MPDLHKNFAYSLVATAPSPATSGTSLVVTGGDGTKFPTAPFNATIWPTGVQPTAANAEIVRVTGIATDTFTITRTQESTSARTVVVGDQISATITAKTATDIDTANSGSVAFTINDSMQRVTISNAVVTTASKILIQVRRPDTTDANDPGWIYIVNIVTISSGSFDVLIVALDWDSPVDTVIPNETISLFYQIYN